MKYTGLFLEVGLHSASAKREFYEVGGGAPSKAPVPLCSTVTGSG